MILVDVSWILVWRPGFYRLMINIERMNLALCVWVFRCVYARKSREKPLRVIEEAFI